MDASATNEWQDQNVVFLSDLAPALMGTLPLCPSYGLLFIIGLIAVWWILLSLIRPRRY